MGPEPRPGPFGGWEAPPEAHFASIDGAYGYTCGLPLEGPPICWGSYSESPNLARYPPSDQWFTAISGGGGHACGLQMDGSAVCWGDLADGPPPGQRFASMSSGVGHTCGLRADDGTVACWGDDAYGQASPPAGARFLGSEPKPPNPYDPGAPLAWSKGATPTSAMPDAQLRRGRLREAGQTLPV